MNNKQNKYPLVSESLSADDLKWMVSEIVYIDMHRTKLGADKDYIVMSLAVMDRNPAHDLASFIESGVHDFEDVEVSPATDEKGRYLVYTELKRDSNAFKTIMDILNDTNRLSGIDEWRFKTMGMGIDQPLTAEAFSASVITDPVEYEQLHPAEPEVNATTESIKQRLNFLMKY
jgi:hypothetical protein